MTTVSLLARPVETHAVHARFGRRGWTLAFGPSQVVVPRLADALDPARRLVADALDLPVHTVRIRLAGDPAGPAPAVASAPWWRGRSAQV